ncbi:MAG: hypothetical protein H6Q76_505 [Firmicutes bacterium]|nr:hypothetical protein [Bacillota bacterium]
MPISVADALGIGRGREIAATHVGFAPSKVQSPKALELWGRASLAADSYLSDELASLRLHRL